MQKFNKIIVELLKDEKRLHTEVENSGKSVISKTINKALLNEYKGIQIVEKGNSFSNILKVWKSIIAKASGKRTSLPRICVKLFKSLDRMVKILYPAENSFINKFVEIRKPIRDKYGDKSEIYKQSTYLMGIGQVRSKEIKQAYQAKVRQKGLKRKEQTPFYDDEIYTLIDKTISSNEPIERIIAVMISVGSRLIEVLQVSTFQENKDDNEIIIKGIAKDPNKKNYENKIIHRPIIHIKSKQVIDSVKFIRDTIDTTGDRKKISGRYNSSVNRKLKQLLPRHKDITSHKLRYIASNLAYLLYGEGGTENTFVQTYFGHESGETSKTYQSINVKLRHSADTQQDVKVKLSALQIADEKNKEEHKEIQHDIKEIKQNLENMPNEVLFPECKNPKIRTNERYKFNLLDKLFKNYEDAKLPIPHQKTIRRVYRFSSDTLTKYYKAHRQTRSS